MGFYLSLACLVAIAASIEAQLTGLSYTDQLLNRRGLGNKNTIGLDRRTAGLGVGSVGLGRRCTDDLDCPRDEVCYYDRQLSQQLYGECTRADLLSGRVGGVYDQTDVLRRVGGVRGQRFGGVRGGVRDSLLGESRCRPYDSQTCLATTNDPLAAWKYTFVSGECVPVQVCETCAGYNSIERNLFDSERLCRRLCLTGSVGALY